MSIVIFRGPTISESEVKAVLDAECRAPAKQGDVYLALKDGATCVGIIDGYFDGVPSVWHKEILWGIERGIPVFGASSMGALRAAELADFGMIGVGKIFENYRTGTTEDDDDVAVVHGPEELGYLPLSEPIVNVTATLQAAAAARVLSDEEAAGLRKLAKSTNYKTRTWKTLVGTAVPSILSQSRGESFSVWLDANRVDQKKIDAVEMLQKIKALSANGELSSAAVCEFAFETTHLWERATGSWSNASQKNSELVDADILHEALFFDVDYQQLRRSAFGRLSGLRHALEQDLEVDVNAQRAALKQFRIDRGLATGAAFQAWLIENDLTKQGLIEVLVEEICLAEVLSAQQLDISVCLIDELKLAGEYAQIAARATAKRKIFDLYEQREETEPQWLPQAFELLRWYFNTKCGADVPENIDDFILKHGLGSREIFNDILKREYLYLNHQAGDA